MAKTPARQSYLYSGPVTPLDIEGESRMLFPGTSYRDLPEDHPIVTNLIERKLLVAETVKAEAAPAVAVADADAGSEGA
ncbi:hypothetical protein ACQZ6A_18400 [Agrobacterium vitis]